MKPGKTASIGGALNAGLFTMTTGLANELADKKIRVNCVVPGLVATELWDKMGKTKEEQEKQFADAGKSLPVGFCATGEDIAEAYLYAVRADYTTGTLIVIGELIVDDNREYS
jgi:NAD(P)-dependent dehydrogenase (short-subunit alcohol dehydrogenase family)